MPTHSHAAFLRAINVGGRNCTMHQLRQAFEAVGLKRIDTFIASGNLVFDAEIGEESTIASSLEVQLKKSLGYEVKTFVRDMAQMRKIAKYQEILMDRNSEAQAFGVAFLETPLNNSQHKQLDLLRNETDQFDIRGSELYWICQCKQSDSKFSNQVFERSIGAKTTFRGFNTIFRLLKKYG